MGYALAGVDTPAWMYQENEHTLPAASAERASSVHRLGVGFVEFGCQWHLAWKAWGYWVLWTSTKRITTQAAAMVKLKGATKFFMGRLLPLK